MLKGFSKLNKESKIEFIKKFTFIDNKQIELLQSFQHLNKEIQEKIENISENVISNYALPFSIAPHFLINGIEYMVPMVTEESSVVAAAASSAKFWSKHGGFKAKVINKKKVGQIYFLWNGDYRLLYSIFPELEIKLTELVRPITNNMIQRGGGITNMDLIKTGSEGLYEIKVYFDTADSMGANFINSCLEIMAKELKGIIRSYITKSPDPEIIMAILSNYTPDCIVESSINCNIKQLKSISGKLSPEKFASKFHTAIQIANSDIYRAVTHNKGIFNGIDAVLIATGNDFRAVEACGHAYAFSNGQYRSLSTLELNKDIFHFSLKIPVSLGTVGGLTANHPLAQLALQILKNPTAKELMKIVATVGLANNFAAIRSLITDGIQKGHMKLHLNNILDGLNATPKEKLQVNNFFKSKQISFSAVSHYIKTLRTV